MRSLVEARWIGHGSGSGASVDRVLHQLFRSERGMVVRQDDFFDRSEAFAAAGVPQG
jgi:hypothetical protein